MNHDINFRKDSKVFSFEGVDLLWGKGKRMMICGQSQSGAHGAGFESDSSSFSCSGYDSLENFIEQHKHELCDGAYIIDSRGLTLEQALNCISGPMEKCDLDPLTIDYWGKITNNVDLNNLPKLSSMAYVSLDIYAAFWRNIGSKIGRFINGAVVWEV